MSRKLFLRIFGGGTICAAFGGALIKAVGGGSQAHKTQTLLGARAMKRVGEIFYPPEYEGKEKHVPIIDAPSEVKPNEPFQVTVTVGKEVPHPNTVEHHIKWIQVFASIEGRNPVHIATFDLGPTFAEPKVTFTMRLQKSATLYAVEYCNIHGLWDYSVDIKVQG